MDDRMTVRVSPTMLAQIDAWISQQSGYVSRQEAVRRCIELAFSQGGPPSAKRPGEKQADTPHHDQPSDDQVVYLD